MAASQGCALRAALKLVVLCSGYQLTTDGHFGKALATFTEVVQLNAVRVINTKAIQVSSLAPFLCSGPLTYRLHEQQNDTSQMITICRHYITAFKIDAQRKENQDNSARY